jgi:DNA invertase Pin-like site-specific DNA recombinase
MSKPSRCAIYARISEDRQGRRAGVARQVEDCRVLADRHGWIVGEPVYLDNDLSAYSGKRRPAYEQMMDDLKTGLRDGLVMWHPDRLHRSPRELEAFIDVVDAIGYRF